MAVLKVEFGLNSGMCKKLDIVAMGLSLGLISVSIFISK